jgi:hypothetical protein
MRLLLVGPHTTMSLPSVKNALADYEKQPSPLDAKQDEIESARNSDSSIGVLDSERDIATNIISVHDDPNLNPWTLRTFVIGFGLSAFSKLFAFASHLPLKCLNSRDLLLQTSINVYCILSANGF